MAKQYKVDEVNNLVAKLKEKGNIIFTNYSGINVKSLTNLRNQLREKNVDYKVVKNNLLLRALNEVGYKGLKDFVRGPIAVAFIKEEIAEAAKVLNDFSKEEESFGYSVGMLENVMYSSAELDKVAKLPPKDMILAQTMSLINGPATGIALGVKQIMASLARGIKAVAEAKSS